MNSDLEQFGSVGFVFLLCSIWRIRSCNSDYWHAFSMGNDSPYVVDDLMFLADLSLVKRGLAK